MNAKVFLIVMVVGAGYCLFANPQYRKATTADGKAVLLGDDGTWRFETPADIAAEKAARDDSVAAVIVTKKKAAQVAAAAAEKAKRILQDSTSVHVKPTQKRKGDDEPDRAALVDVIKNNRLFDVRMARWGMTKDDVRKSENRPPLADETNRLEYKLQLLGLDSRIVYTFLNGKLAGAEYLIEQDDVNPFRFYEDFQHLKEYLVSLYGDPVSDDKTWSNDIYKGDEGNWGFAISLGFLTCRTIWQNTTTQIALNQSGGNHMIKTNIEYDAHAQTK